MALDPRAEAVLLRDDSIGVSTETKARKVQSNGESESCRITVNRDWLEQLNLAEQGSPTLHSVSLGLKPVVVQNPAIIVQPMAIVGDLDD